MPNNPRAWKIATATCKKKGYKSFKKRTAGSRCRKKVAEGVGRSLRKKKR